MNVQAATRKAIKHFNEGGFWTVLTMVVFTFIAVLPGAGPIEPSATVTSSASIDVEAVDLDTADMLVSAGFTSDPNDGAERLYAPAVVEVEDAPEWLVVLLLDAGYTSKLGDGGELLYAPTK